MIEIILIAVILILAFRKKVSGLTYDRLDSLLLKAESKLTTIGWAHLLALILLIGAIIHVRPDTQCAYLGRYYANLASNPFSFDPGNPVSYRILTPLISYLIGLRGCSIIITNLIISLFFIANIYTYGRDNLPRPGDALLLSLAVTFSLTVLTIIHCGGYCDVLTYFIIFLMWRYRNKRLIFYALFCLGLFNRESILFLLPWFAYFSIQGNEKKLPRLAEILLGFGISIGIYLLFRYWVSGHMDVTYSVSYYLKPFQNGLLGYFPVTFYYHGLGLFSVFIALWIIPVLYLAASLRNGNIANLVGAILILLGAYVQLFIAQDTSRMFTLSFIIMILSLTYLFKRDLFNIRHWIYGAFFFNLMIPQVYTAGHKIEIWQSLVSHIIIKYVF